MVSSLTPNGYDLNFREEFILPSKKNRPGTIITPEFITLHNTSNRSSGADASAHSKFVRNKGYYMHNGKKNWVSWHFTVDDDEVIQHLPTNEKGWHAGPGNSKSIGIETCMHKQIDQDAADERLAQLVAILLVDLGLDLDKVVSHKYWTNKNCPILLLEKWNELIKRIDEIYQKNKEHQAHSTNQDRIDIDHTLLNQMIY